MRNTVAGLSDDLSKNKLGQYAELMKGWTTLDILNWASASFSKRITCATGFGPEGCVLIDIIGRHQLPIDLFTLDTGLLFQETYTLKNQLEHRYGIVIRSVKPKLTVQEQANKLGQNLWDANPDLCCETRKVAPLRETLSAFDAWITAIRREQTAARAHAQVVEWDEKFQLIKVNPIILWSNEEVWKYLHEHKVPYNSLHDENYPSIGCTPCTSPVKHGENLRSGRWRGKSKSECGLHDLQRFSA